MTATKVKSRLWKSFMPLSYNEQTCSRLNRPRPTIYSATMSRLKLPSLVPCLPGTKQDHRYFSLNFNVSKIVTRRCPEFTCIALVQKFTGRFRKIVSGGCHHRVSFQEIIPRLHSVHFDSVMGPTGSGKSTVSHSLSSQCFRTLDILKVYWNCHRYSGDCRAWFRIIHKQNSRFQDFLPGASRFRYPFCRYTWFWWHDQVWRWHLQNDFWLAA